ncbi:MAG: FliH/SctL family protein [Polaromonas sp.]|jgi:flagellar assembly protein FliH
MTALSRLRPNSSSGLVPQEEIRELVPWEFGDMSLGGDGACQPGELSAKLKQACEEAYAEGFAAGRAAAELELREEVEKLKREHHRHAAESLKELLQSARQGVCDVQAGLADEVLSLVCGLSRQMLRRELSEVSIATLMPIVLDALGMLNEDAELAVIRLNPDDLHVLQAHLPAALEGRDLEWTADPAVAPGGCLVESAGAHIDASVPRRWERAVAALGLPVPWQEEGPDAV